MATSVIRRPRVATPDRWQKALQRALDGQVQVRQLAGSGAWIATSATDPATAYEIEITGEIAHGCSCLAGLNSDPVCCHRAAFYHQIGMLDLDPEPQPPAPAAPLRYVGPSGRLVELVARTDNSGLWWATYERDGRRFQVGMARPLADLRATLTQRGFVAA
jgi:hypothetical protein